jgi:hypothetical protein
VAKIKHLNNTNANTINNTSNSSNNTTNNTTNNTNNNTTNNTSNNSTANTTANNTAADTSNSSGQAEASERIQLIAMSATVGNLRELAHFLSAELFTDDWRPVRLEEFVKVGRDIFQVAGGGSSSNQCCGSGIRWCLFDSGIRDKKKIKIRIRNELPGSYIRELRNNFLGYKII